MFSFKKYLYYVVKLSLSGYILYIFSAKGLLTPASCHLVQQNLINKEFINFLKLNLHKKYIALVNIWTYQSCITYKIFNFQTPINFPFTRVISYVNVIVILIVIIIAGCLVIYNISSISVKTDIRIYALLKSTGTTGRQLKKIVHIIVMLSISLSLIIPDYIVILAGGFDFKQYQQIFLESDFQLDQITSSLEHTNFNGISQKTRDKLDKCPYSEANGYVYFSKESTCLAHLYLHCLQFTLVQKKYFLL